MNKKFKTKKNIIFAFIFIIFILSISIIYKKIENIKIKKEEIYSILDQKSDSKKSDLIFVQKLAYLGLKQFQDGLLDDDYKKLYQYIIKGDMDQFEENVLNGTLSTASTPLIQGTIDFLSKKLNKKINIILNTERKMKSLESHVLSSIYKLENIKNKNNKDNTISVKLCNINNSHFYVEKPNDTPGDGYCFFHALSFILDKKIPNWRNIIEKDLNFNLKKIKKNQ
ncbi:hypothetical protein [Candidatus Phytoplasma sacchari]|uniref:OTU domain-containing protein n=1 Tax=Candidatus Phytoplasma sacchari TaxID=2609813 RepID=A0ABY7M4V1_9MOLU|nr:hypothetical protein O7R10_00805 [Candidatus Phytoplasma sacchari]